MPDIDEATGQAAWDDEQGVNANVVAVACVTRRKPLRGDRDPAQTIFVECPGSRFLAAALLHLDKGEDAAAPGNEVDLAAWNARPPREDSPALETQPPGREGFRPPTARFGLAAVQLPPASSSARA